MKTQLLGLLALGVSTMAGAVGIDTTCRGNRLVYLFAEAHSGVHLPTRSGALFLDDGLLERWRGGIGEFPEPKDYVLDWKNESELISQKVEAGSKQITVSSRTLEVKRRDGQPLTPDHESWTEKVYCTEVRNLIPIP